MTPKEEQRFAEVLAWVCAVVFIGTTIYLITIV